MNNSFIFSILFAGLALTACSSSDSEPSTTPSLPPVEPGRTVVFQDDFETFDFNHWSKEAHEAGWTNNELQAYNYNNATVGIDDNKSVLILTAEKKDGKIVSGRVNTKNKVSFKYGRLEASIKLPATANGLWPALWMMGDNGKQWPACGEIDIMEMGDAEGIRSGNTTTRVNTALHYGPDQAHHQQDYYATNFSKNLQDGKYHLYTLDWDKDQAKISIDGTLIKTFDIADNSFLHDNFYIIINLAVGGDFTGIRNAADVSALNGGKKMMYIDWIRITN